MRARTLPALAASLAVVSTVVAAQPPAQSRGAVMSGTTFQPPKLSSPQPYVFRVPTPATTHHAKTRKPTVVCGLRVIDADPNFDPAIRRPAQRPNDTTTF